ncbi:gamma-glutamylcyclotransferase [Streptomyces viridosporus]|uniref:gamma-glutamylcyclotransferase n=1 Tax=Streptomyces viridosporus TaxID=67581 RepID=UPI0021001475|nr:gamma-glutamylcyclotransferase [Streptomyces viridosporus]
MATALAGELVNPDVEVLLARSEGALVGIAITLAHHPDPADPDPWIGLLMVDAGAQRQGRGRRLATLVEDPLAQVFVALYDIAPMDEESLDRWEGAGLDIYRRTRVRVHTLDGEEPAWTYVLNAYEGGLPSARYLGEIADAAESAGAPHDYVMELRKRPC